jgi:hypothetical protein
MSHHTVTRLVAAVAILLAVSASASAQCSSNTLRGTWAFQNGGTVMMPAPGYPVPVPVPFVSQGLMKVGRAGAYTLHATLSVGGQVQDVDLTGAIQMNPDCTGTAFDSFGGTTQLMMVGNDEMLMLSTKHPLGPATDLARFRRVSRNEPRCTSATVRGIYRGTAEGTFMVSVPGQPQPVPMPFSGMFTMTFDGSGGGDAVATASLGGTIADVTFSDMSMTVNRDCTATLKYSGDVKQLPGQLFTGTLKYIVLDHGDGLLGMEVESSVGLPIELESHRRIAVKPGSER